MHNNLVFTRKNIWRGLFYVIENLTIFCIHYFNHHKYIRLIFTYCLAFLNWAMYYINYFHKNILSNSFEKNRSKKFLFSRLMKVLLQVLFKEWIRFLNLAFLWVLFLGESKFSNKTRFATYQKEASCIRNLVL